MPPSAEPATWSLPELYASSGCFETMRVYGGTIFRLASHLERLSASAQSLGVRVSMPREQLGHQLRRAVRRSGLKEAIVRVAMIPRPGCPAEGGVAPPREDFSRKCDSSTSGGAQRGRGMIPSSRVAAPSIVVQPVPLPPPVLYRRGLRLAIVPTRKFPIAQINPQAKFSARQGSVLAIMEAQLRGADEAMFLDTNGYVTESTASNLGLIKGGVFIAPPCWLGLLPGITWQAVEEVAHHLGLPVQDVPVTRHELYNADEVFLTSTIKEVIPVTQIDGRRIAAGTPGPWTARLRRGFRVLVRRELRLSR